MLTLEEIIIETHDDFNPFSLILTGFDDNKNWVIRLEHTDDEHPDANRITDAVINLENAYRMSVKMNIKLTELPAELARQLQKTDGFFTSREVEHYFSHVLQFVSNYGTNYTLRHRHRDK